MVVSSVSTEVYLDLCQTPSLESEARHWRKLTRRSGISTPLFLMIFQAACIAKDAGALRRLSSCISVDVTDAAASSYGDQIDTTHDMGDTALVSLTSRTADVCIQSGGGESCAYLVSSGGISVWRRGHNHRRYRCPRRQGMDHPGDAIVGKGRLESDEGFQGQDGEEGDDTSTYFKPMFHLSRR